MRLVSLIFIVLVVDVLSCVALSEEPRWVPECSFVHTEHVMPFIDNASFSSDDALVEIHTEVPDETNGPTAVGICQYDAATGKGDGKMVRVRQEGPGIPKSLLKPDGAHVYVRMSDRKHFIVAQTTDKIHLFDTDEKLLHTFPTLSREDKFFFDQDDAILTIIHDEGFRRYSTKSGVIQLEMTLGQKPDYVGQLNQERYVVCRFPAHDSCAGPTTELVELATGKRIGPFDGWVETFSHGGDYFTLRVVECNPQIYNSTLELRKLPGGERLAAFAGAASPMFSHSDNVLLMMNDFKNGQASLVACGVRDAQRLWSRRVAQYKWFFNEIVGQDKVVCIQDDDGAAQIVDIATGKTVLDFKDFRERPEFAGVDLTKMGFTFSHTSLRFLTYWQVGTDHSKLQVIVWKPVDTSK